MDGSPFINTQEGCVLYTYNFQLVNYDLSVLNIALLHSALPSVPCGAAKNVYHFESTSLSRNSNAHCDLAGGKIICHLQ